MTDYRVLIYMADTIGILLLVMILIFSRRGRIVMSRESRLYYKAESLNIVLCALDFPVFYYDGLNTPHSRSILYIANTVQAIVLTAMTYLWMMYVMERTGSEKLHTKRFLYMSLLPVLFNVTVYIINFFVPIVYRISSDFHYIPDGVMYPAVLAVDLFYFIGSSIYGLIATHGSKNYQFFPFIFVLIFTISGSVIQSIDYHISVIYLSTSMAFLAIFMEIQNENSYIDPLSRVYNRQYLNKYVARLCSDNVRYGHSAVTFLMIDVDGFKKINDNCGHLVGDQAIRDIGQILLEASPTGAVCTRYGGDEFVVILPTVDQTIVQGFIEKFHRLRRELNESGQRPFYLRVSIGNAVMDMEKDTADTIIKRMDQAMYEQKKLHHKSTKEQEDEGNVYGYSYGR